LHPPNRVVLIQWGGDRGGGEIPSGLSLLNDVRKRGTVPALKVKKIRLRRGGKL